MQVKYRLLVFLHGLQMLVRSRYSEYPVVAEKYSNIEMLEMFKNLKKLSGILGIVKKNQ
jgi:hypothetical protein